MEIATPVFLLDDGDVEVFESLESLARYVEPVDAASGRLTAFDSNGRQLWLRDEGGVAGAIFVGGGATAVEPSQPPEYDPDRLVLALRSFVLRVGSSRLGISEEWLREASLDELVGKVADFLGVS